MDCLYIRADMNKVIATGHVMRCLSVADAAREMGISSAFICADKDPEELITSRGYRFICLETDFQDLESELSQMHQLIEQEKITHLLVDSYQVTDTYLRSLSEKTKVIYMDDVNAFPYPVQAVINYANYADSFSYEKAVMLRQTDRKRIKNESTVARVTCDEIEKVEIKYILGCRYVPLRKMFQNKPPKLVKKSVENLLLMSGGSDPENMLKEILSAIPKGKYKKITVLCGRFYPHREALIQENSGYPEVEILPNVDNMDYYLAEADLAISAGGSALYELSAMGTPAITFSFIDNQMENVKRFDMDGLMDCAGDAREKVDTDKLDDFGHINMIESPEDAKGSRMKKSVVPGRVAELLLVNEDYERRLNRSRRLQELVDGNGAAHIVEELLKL